MFNVMKAQNYQIKRDNTTYYYILGALLLTLFIGLIQMTDSAIGSKINGGKWFVSVTAAVMPFMANLFTLLFTARICGWDIQDRTINFELMNGSKRSSVFFGRVILSILWGVTTVYAITILPVAAVGIIKGWGHTISIAGTVRRLAMSLFPMIKMCCFYALLTFLLLDWRAVIVIGFIIGQVELLALMLVDELDTGIPAVIKELVTAFSMNKILDVGNSALGYFNGEDVIVIKDTFTVPQLMTTVCVCAVGAAVYLAIGCLVFRRRDLK